MSDVDAMRTYFTEGQTATLAFRLMQLRRLKAGIEEREERILDALKTDLGKSAFEAFSSEVGIVYSEISYHLAHLKRWMGKTRVKGALASMPSRSYTIAQSLGVVLIISPWNYPFQLSLVPLVSAIAAGNCALLKPSTQSAATTAIIAELITSLFDERYIQVSTDRSVIEEQWDHIFFTGGAQVGRMIAQSAAQRLIPTTLELGGKSPVIVTEHASPTLAARRIIWGKCLNSGQTCVAPDYVLVHTDAKAALVEAMKRSLTAMFGSDVLGSEDYSSIIGEDHFNRLITLFEYGKLLWGGQIDPKRLRIAPTLMGDVDLASPLMQQEIFGPILPIITYERYDEALAFIKERPHPLAAYLFSNDKNEQQRFVNELSFGGGCINDVVMHLANPRLPFGGIGESGMGSYHGKAGFLTFSHIKSITHTSCILDIPLRYAPYRSRLGLLKRLFR
ncbi:MAG: aldehyde dehydrogenase [Sphaerochaeta sp.]|jgi:aldehyde dehydrogenase (NAD+)|nr:aldehyde dehydrogenase [Sphaerochaeta sp.]